MEEFVLVPKDFFVKHFADEELKILSNKKTSKREKIINFSELKRKKKCVKEKKTEPVYNFILSDI